MGDHQYGKIQGNPDLVGKKAKAYQEVANAIQRSTATLDEIANQIEQKSLAMDKTRELARDVSSDIGKALDRYRETGDALAAYAPALRQAQDDGDPWVAQIAHLEGSVQSARTTEYYAQGSEQSTSRSSSATPEELAEARRTAHNATRDRENLEASLETAKSKWQAAEDAKNRAAETAKSKITDVVSGENVHGLKDGFWDKVGHVLKQLYKVFKVICDVAGILAIFLSWVPILGQVLLVLAAIGSILQIVETIVKFHKGEIGWGGLLLGVGMGVIGLFGGKLAGTLTKVAKSRAIVNAAGRTNSMTRLATRLGGGDLAKGTQMITEANQVARNSDKLLSVKSVLKSPFVRSDAMRNLYQLKDAGQVTFKEGLKYAAKDAFVFPLKSPLGKSSELLRNPVLFHNADKIAGAAVSMHLVNFGVGAYKGANGAIAAYGGDNGWTTFNSTVGLASPVTDGPYVQLAQVPGKIVDWGTKTADAFDRMV
ncbi:hypothetical protein ACFT5B_05775 [Luteimicrobium sp. NPDC057192]|uniref:hypothetical protein n=1 Tax=Luteimicrobium sp. NPDC057192 TaxID=3346042 RepID=UPI0036440D19